MDWEVIVIRNNEALAKVIHEAIEHSRSIASVNSFKREWSWSELPEWYQGALKEAAQAVLAYLGLPETAKRGCVTRAVEALSQINSEHRNCCPALNDAIGQALAELKGGG
jgi:hypothetical protein